MELDGGAWGWVELDETGFRWMELSGGACTV